MPVVELNNDEFVDGDDEEFGNDKFDDDKFDDNKFDDNEFDNDEFVFVKLLDLSMCGSFLHLI